MPTPPIGTNQFFQARQQTTEVLHPSDCEHLDNIDLVLGIQHRIAEDSERGSAPSVIIRCVGVKAVGIIVTAIHGKVVIGNRRASNSRVAARGVGRRWGEESAGELAKTLEHFLADGQNQHHDRGLAGAGFAIEHVGTAHDCLFQVVEIFVYFADCARTSYRPTAFSICVEFELFIDLECDGDAWTCLTYRCWVGRKLTVIVAFKVGVGSRGA